MKQKILLFHLPSSFFDNVVYAFYKTNGRVRKQCSNPYLTWNSQNPLKTTVLGVVASKRAIEWKPNSNNNYTKI